jgi:conjugative transfer pilus assembly protein TraH
MLVVLVGCVIGLVPARADIGSDMQGMFDQMGVVGNLTDPGAFRGQSRNLYTGGNLSMRVPQRNFQLFTLKGPSLKMGCGGIDLFGGSFSFINSDQLVAMLQNIGSVALTQAFMLALDTYSPEIAKTIKELQSWAQRFNGMSINSCQAGQALAYGMFGENNEAQSHACRAIKGSDGATPDYAKSWFDCDSQGAAGVVKTAQANDADTKKNTFVEGNIMWRALQANTALDDTTRELLMSFTGTYILRSQGNGVDAAPSVTPVARTLSKISDFVDGNGTEDSNGDIVLTVLSCGADTIDCMTPTKVATTVKSFRTRTEDAMRDMVDGIINRQAINGASIGFVNAARLPVKRLIDVTTQMDQATAYSAINNWRDAVAMDIAQGYLLGALSDARRMMRLSTASSVERKYLEEIGRSISEAIAETEAEGQNNLTKEVAMQQVATYLEQMNRIVWSGTPASLRASLQFQ